MKNKLISKIRCNNPNRKGSASRNYNYLIYIATRPGTDLTADDDTVSGHGLFGNFDVHDVHNVAGQIYNLTKTGYNIYNGIISLTESDAVALGYNHKDAWVNYLNSVMPSVARQFGIPIQHLRWTASVHMESGHPHCHYMFWSAQKMVRSPYIHSSVENRVREYLSGEINREDRLSQALDKTAERDIILSFGKGQMEKVMEEINELISCPSIAHKMSASQISALSGQLLNLLPQLPTHGRLNYKLMPGSLKEEINRISDSLLANKDIAKHAERYLQLTNALSDSYSVSQAHRTVNLDISKNDLYTRMGNIILKKCKTILLNEEYQNALFDLRSRMPSEFSNDAEPDIFSPEPDIAGQKYTLSWSKGYKEALNLLYQTKNPAAAEKLFLAEAQKGNALAYEQLGKLHRNKLLKDSSPEKAHLYYLQALTGFLKLYDALPQKAEYISYKLGKLYEQGLGTDVNYEKAAMYYRSAGNNEFAMFSLANMYLYEKLGKLTPEKFDLALQLMKASADDGFCYAAYSYAKLSSEHNLESIDICNQYYKAALDSFLSLENKDDKLLYRIGTMYYKGLGTPADPKMAYKHFTDAAELKNADAYYALGKTYADQDSPYHSPPQAEKYFLLAIKAGKKYAYAPLARLYLQNGKYEKVIPLLEEGIRQNDINSYTLLGRIYLWGGYPCIQKDYQKGRQLLQHAASEGSEYAIQVLNTYEQVVHKQISSCCYNIFADIFSELEYHNHQKTFQLNNLKKKSKEQLNEAVQQSKI